jgi:hypothetical protein
MRSAFFQWLMIHFLLMIVAFLVLFFTGCGSITKQIESEIWSVDPQDGSIFRVLDNGTEEFILCTDQSSKKFKAMYYTDLQKWLNYAAENCSCRVPE